MPRWMLVGLIGVAVAYVGVCLALFLLQRSMIYFPQPRMAPAGTPLLTLAADGRQVLATMREHEGPSALIYFGGNAEDVSASLPGMAAAFPDRALYLLHYPGYGGAPGSAERGGADRRRAGAVRPGRRPPSAGDGARPQPRQRRGDPGGERAPGRAAGAGDALRQPGGDRCRPVPFVPVGWMLRDKFESDRHAAKVTAPTLLIAAEKDEVIPRASTERLHGRFAGGVATLGVIAGADHNFPDNHPAYLRLLRGAP